MTARTTKIAAKPEHPSYPNPTISEALCEIRFELPEGASWKPSLPGEFFKRVQDDYPEMEPAYEVGLQLEFGPKKIGHSLSPPRQLARFTHASRPLILQLSENVFSVNVLPVYPGWSSMREDVVTAWSQARSVLKPAKVTRVGLRYINRIERKKPDETPSEWLSAGDYISAGVLRSKGAFLSRVESHIDQENVLIVTVAEIQSDDTDAMRPIVLDIDRIVEKQLSVKNDALLKEMDSLHEHVWQVFESAMTPRLAKQLKGVVK